jgi:hypothetical protein
MDLNRSSLFICKKAEKNGGEKCCKAFHGKAVQGAGLKFFVRIPMPIRELLK